GEPRPPLRPRRGEPGLPDPAELVLPPAFCGLFGLPAGGALCPADVSPLLLRRLLRPGLPAQRLCDLGRLRRPQGALRPALQLLPLELPARPALGEQPARVVCGPRQRHGATAAADPRPAESADPEYHGQQDNEYNEYPSSDGAGVTEPGGHEDGSS